jgi:hypothetical protein
MGVNSWSQEKKKPNYPTCTHSTPHIKCHRVSETYLLNHSGCIYSSSVTSHTDNAGMPICCERQTSDFLEAMYNLAQILSSFSSISMCLLHVLFLSSVC